MKHGAEGEGRGRGTRGAVPGRESNESYKNKEMRMTIRRIATPLGLAAAIFLAVAGTAAAKPSYTQVCSGCHDPNAAVTVTATLTGYTGSNADYSIAVSNTNSGSEGWAVFSGAKVASGFSPGSFSVPAGSTYTVYGISGTPSVAGLKSIQISPPLPPPPVDARLFIDDFSDATTAGDPDWETVLGSFGGSGTFGPTTADRSVALVDQGVPGLAPFGGGRIETKVRLTSLVTRTRADVIFDYVDAGHYRYVRLDNATKKLVVGQVGDIGTDAAGTLGVLKKKLFANQGRWIRLRVDVDPAAGTVTVYVNGSTTPAIAASFDQVGVGRVGLAASKARKKAAFDNFTVWDETVLP